MKYRLFILGILLMDCTTLCAQQSARTFYFMDNAPIRLGLNPALQPQKGYFSFPFLGSVGASVVTNTLSVQDFMDMMDNESDYLHNDKLMNKLKDNNYVYGDLAWELISFGFYSGKGFWNFDLSTKMALNVSVPRSMFEFVRDADGLEKDLLSGRADYEIRDLQLHLNAFAQVGLGYSRPVFDWLTVGGKVKFLVGLGNLNLEVDRMQIQANGTHYKMETKAKLEASIKGLELLESTQGVIDNVDFDTPGIGGFGAGFDFGMVVNFFKHLNVSAAVTDLGFIKWKKEATQTAISDKSYTWEPGNETDIFAEDFYQLRLNEKAQSRSSSLFPTLNLGAEYSFWHNRVGVGLLSSTTFYEPEAYSELTASLNFRPGGWFGAAVSYSFLHSDFKTLGLGIRLGPIFLATDYMLTGGFKDIHCINGYLGINFPIGTKNVKYKKLEKIKSGK